MATITINDNRYYRNKQRTFNNRKGVAISFFGNEEVEFVHKISHKKPLQSISIFSSIENLNKFTDLESEIYTKHLYQLFNPQDDFVEGPDFYMTPIMQNADDALYKSFPN